MSRLDVSLLGTFHTTLNGATVTRFRSDAARALLATLALCAPAPCRRETLTGLLWPELPEVEARHNLRQTLNRLRTAIGDREADPPVLLVTRKAIQFNLACDHWLDVHAFDERLAACASHRHRRLDACRACIRRMQEAADLYRGDLLAGFSFPSAAWEGWLVAEREGRHRQALEALHHLATYHERRGEYEQVQRYARRQVELEPWGEGAHRQWMRCLALSGQRGAALAQYAACRRVVRAELGVEPEAETTALYARIRGGLESAAGVSSPSHNLPAPLTPFVGREAEMAALEERLGDPDCRLLTLVGPGGIGKTRLAQEAAAVQVDVFPDGVYWVPLAALRSAEALVPSVAHALGFSFYGGAGSGAALDPRQQVLDYLRDKSALLVLDNAEHLLEEHLAGEGGQEGGVASLAVDVLRAAPGVTLLVTSRERLNVRGEHLFPVGGMEVPLVQGRSDPGAVGDEVCYDSVQLYVRSAQRVRAGFEPGAEEWAQIARICRLVGGVPLGILLAASWVQVLAPDEIAARIGSPTEARTEQGLDFLAADLHGVPERQRSMRAVFDHSWNLLTEQEQHVFACLSVFRGGFTEVAAQAVAGASLRDLLGLANKSLLHRASALWAGEPTLWQAHGDRGRAAGDSAARRGTGARYELHELLRQYAAERLAQDAGDLQATCERHGAYYVASVRQWAKDFQGARQQAALAAMDAEIENVRAAWEWAAARGQVKRLDQAIEGLGLFYDWRGRYREGETACRLAAERLAANAAGDGVRVRARLLAWRGVFHWRLGRSELASRGLQQSLNRLQELERASTDVRREKAFTLLQMSHVASDADRRQARRLCAQSLALYRSLGATWEVANALAVSGQRAENVGAYDAARQLFEESLAQRRSLGDRKGIADSLWGLAEVANRHGRLADAQQLLGESIQIRRSLRDRAGVADGLHELGVTLIFRGEFDRAQGALQECMVTYEELGDRAGLAHAYTLLGHVYEGLGQYPQARACGQTSLALAQECGFQRGIGLSWLLVGSVCLAYRAYAEARNAFRASAAAVDKIGHRHDLSLLTLAYSVYAAYELGDLDQARQRLYEGLRVSSEIGAYMPLVCALPAGSLLLADRGEVERAVELYALALCHPFIANSCWFADVVGKHVDRAAATLPPDVVTEARERGRARDLDATVKELLAEWSES